MEVNFDSRTDCVFATIAGRMSPDELPQVFYKVIDAALERGVAPILVNFSALDGNLTASERFTLGESVAAYTLSKSRTIRLRIAIVGKAPLVDGFGALASSNRGLNAKAFSEIPPALDWLGIPRPGTQT
jgi:hypothetical protein